MHGPGRQQWQVLLIPFVAVLLVVCVAGFVVPLVVLLGVDRARMVANLTAQFVATVMPVAGAMWGVRIWGQSQKPKRKEQRK
jgi:hypothetical protein